MLPQVEVEGSKEKTIKYITPIPVPDATQDMMAQLLNEVGKVDSGTSVTCRAERTKGTVLGLPLDKNETTAGKIERLLRELSPLDFVFLRNIRRVALVCLERPGKATGRVFEYERGRLQKLNFKHDVSAVDISLRVREIGGDGAGGWES